MTQRIALVTGAVGGLGTAICKSLLGAGVRVVGNFFPGDPAKEAWEEARKAEGLDIPLYGFDVSDFAQCEAAIEKIVAEVGPIDILVNNAGITRDKMFARMEKGQWDAVIATNLGSLFNVTHSISPKMAERGFGRIINISSVNGVKGPAGQTNYSAAKAGVIGFSKALAAELATKGVTVNAIAPGYIGTDMVMAIKEEIRNSIIDTVPVKRLGKPEEIGAAVVYLASDLAGYVTGATLNVNGGLNYQ